MERPTLPEGYNTWVVFADGTEAAIDRFLPEAVAMIDEVAGWRGGTYVLIST